MKVIKKMKQLKELGFRSVLIRDNISKEEHVYQLIDFDNISNKNYVEENKDILNKKVLKMQIIPKDNGTGISKIARITYTN